MLGQVNGDRGEINPLSGIQGVRTVLQREGTH
jgi:hypothetical protein